MRDKLGHSLWGFIFIIAGVGIAGNSLEFWDFQLFFTGWWTLFLIIPGIISIIQNGLHTANFILILLGLLFLLDERGIVQDGIVFKLMFPLILVIIGFSILFNRGVIHSKRKNRKEQGDHHSYSLLNKLRYSSEDHPDYLAIFGGSNVKNTSKRLKGGSASAIFGGIQVDLRDAIVTEDISFGTTAVFGGVEILVPDNVQVKANGVPIFGGHEFKANPPKDTTLPTFTINCVSIFGGTEIK